MSTNHTAPMHGAHDHGHHHDDHHHDGGADHGSFKSYMIGFVLSVFLTAIPFWLVMTGGLENRLWTVAIVMAFAVIQIVVHMIYFLHMNTSSEGGWTMLATMFTIILVVIVLSGSLWVMFHLNTNMMPQHDMDAMDELRRLSQ